MPRIFELKSREFTLKVLYILIYCYTRPCIFSIAGLELAIQVFELFKAMLTLDPELLLCNHTKEYNSQTFLHSHVKSKCIDCPEMA
jgi:hypothetical protein